MKINYHQNFTTDVISEKKSTKKWLKWVFLGKRNVSCNIWFSRYLKIRYLIKLINIIFHTENIFLVLSWKIILQNNMIFHANFSSLLHLIHFFEERGGVTISFYLTSTQLLEWKKRATHLSQREWTCANIKLTTLILHILLHFTWNTNEIQLS